MKTTKINTYLPVFTGFYCTVFEPFNEEIEIEEINDHRVKKGLTTIGYDDCQFNYKEYEKTVSKECVDAVETKLQETIGKGIEIEFEKLVSPKEYNFANDSINVEISLNKEAQQTIVKILKDNEQEFKTFIKDRYSSCDGFISSHSKYSEEWIEAIKTFDNDLLSHKLGAVLGFILEIVEEYDDSDLYNDLESTFIYCDNYTELIGE